MNEEKIFFKLSLKAVRTNMDLNQNEMAEKLKVSPGTWYNWENGITKISGNKVQELSIISGIPQQYIFLPK